jgi:hypothetical protein
MANKFVLTNEEIVHSDGKWKVFPRKPKKGSKKRKALGTHSTREEAVKQLQAIEISKNESAVLSFSQFVLLEKRGENPSQYKAPEGSARDKKLDRAKELLKKGKKKEAYALRDKMEKAEREKPSWKNISRKDSKLDESAKHNLSKETLAKIRAVAKKKGYSFASLKQEYIKGLGAFYSSGSRPGMTAHQWAMARVNAASPSKSWANVKKVSK